MYIYKHWNGCAPMVNKQVSEYHTLNSNRNTNNPSTANNKCTIHPIYLKYPSLAMHLTNITIHIFQKFDATTSIEITDQTLDTLVLHDFLCPIASIGMKFNPISFPRSLSNASFDHQI